METVKVRKKFRRRLKVKQKKSLLNRRIRKTLFFSFLSVALLAALALSSLFDVKEIEVVGLTKYDAEDIIKSTNVRVGSNWYRTLGFKIKDIFTFTSTVAQMHISKAFPYIDDVSVRFIPLGKVKINVLEKTPYIMVQNEDQYAVIDDEGKCLELVTEKKENMPVLVNCKINHMIAGDFIEFSDPYVLDNVKKLFYMVSVSDSDTETKLLGLITDMDFSNIENAIITLESRVKVNIGDISKLGNYKMSYLKEIFFKKIQKDEKGMLDFSKDNNPVFNLG